MQVHVRALVALASTILVASSAKALTIYDGSLNTAPEAQGYVLLGPPGASTYETQGTGKVTLNTAASSNQAGWANNLFPLINLPVNSNFPTLNSTNGFVLSFDLKVLSESHDNENRAGFSVILLDSNHLGVELGFWAPIQAGLGHVWAQSLSGTNFVHGEDVGFDTGSTTHYDLGIQGGTYQLFANGNPILNGNTRDYLPGDASPDPYGLNNYLFVGDDTTNATASIELSSLSIVPEPGSALLMLGGFCLATIRRSCVKSRF